MDAATITALLSGLGGQIATGINQALVNGNNAGREGNGPPSKANGFGSEPKPNRGSSVFLENPLDPNPRFQRFPREPVGPEPAVPALSSRTRWTRTRGSSAFLENPLDPNPRFHG